MLLLLISISACGQTHTTASQAPFSNNKPVGIGTTPEPGTDGKPKPLPNGHWQTIVAANGIVYIGSENGTLYALRNRDGSVLWHYKVGTPVFLSSVVNGIVYFSGYTSVYALDAQTGAVRWQHQINASAIKPIVVNGVVYIDTALTTNANGIGSSSIYALQAANGSLLWHYTYNTSTPGLLAVSNGILYYKEPAGSFKEPHQTITALRASDGHVLWHLHIDDTDGLINAAPAEANGIVYISAVYGAIYAVRADTGTVLWHVAHPAGLIPIVDSAPPTVANGIVYIGTQQAVDALRASDGSLLWENKENVSMMPFLVHPIVVGDMVYASYSNGTVSALRAKDGSQLWQYHGTFPQEPLVVADGRVYVDAGPSLYTLRASDGTLLWQKAVDYHGSSNFASSVVITDGTIYVSADNGIIPAIRASDGKQLWHYAIQENAVPTDPVYGAWMTFTKTTSYQQALDIITNLGLQAAPGCPTFRWDGTAEKDAFNTNRSLTVVSTVSAAPLWLDRLQTTPGVASIQPSGPHSCPMIMWPASGLRYLQPDKAGTFVRVTFSGAMKSYDDAIEAINGLGFRLAAPCYEHARAQGAKPTWNPMQQSDTFGKDHTLLLATTSFNSTAWMDQLRGTAGVTKVEAPFSATC